MLTRCVAVVCLTFAAASPAVSQEAVDKAHLGRTLWSAFQCATYAEMSGDTAEQARLFEVGLRSGRAFLDALKARQIPPDVVRRQIPIGVSMLLQGPTPDFILGRIFENAMRDAYDSIVIKDEHGFALEPSKWVNDEELRASRAKTKYLKGNCDFVK